MKRGGVLTVIALLAGLAAGCGDDDGSDDGADTGGGDTAMFEAEGLDVTFEYPGDFEQREEIEFSRAAGSSAAATAGVGIDETNLIAVQRFDLEREVTTGNLDSVRREADDLFSELAGEPVEGARRRVGGLPALEYQIALEDPPEGETRAVAVFDGDVEYLINCQSTPEHRDRIEQACDRALFTLEVE